MIFQANIDETEIGRVKLGQTAILTLDAYPDQPLNLSVEEIGFTSTVTSGGGTAFPVKLNLGENPNQQYRLGMNGDLEIIIAQKTNVITVPFEAVREKNNEIYVFVKTDAGFEKRLIEPGFSNDYDTQIKGGLQMSELVAITGFKELENNQWQLGH